MAKRNPFDKAVEKFAANTSNIGETLRKFVARVQETEFPNTVEATQQLILDHEKAHTEVKEDLANIIQHGEILLGCFRTVHNKQGEEEQLDSSCVPPCKLVHIQAVERLLQQLVETEKNFIEFWVKHEKKLAQCLNLREFEESFKEFHSKVLVHLEMLNTMSDTGDSLHRVDNLVLQLQQFEDESKSDVNNAEELWTRGEDFIDNDHYAVDCIRPKCIELQRVCEQYRELMRKQRDLLAKSRLLHERLEKANKWCSDGVDLLAKQQLDKFNTSDGAQTALQRVDEFLSSAHEFHLADAHDLHENFDCVMSPQSRESVEKTLERISEVTHMCDKRRDSLKRLINKPKQTVKVSPITHQHQTKQYKSSGRSVNSSQFNQSPNSTIYDSQDSAILRHTSPSGDLNPVSLATKRGHVINELIATERSYVMELNSIIEGYLKPMEHPAFNDMIPLELRGMNHILFGNLEEIYRFHSEVFLKELESCSVNPAHVGQCFIQNREAFSIYSVYCQNKPGSEALISETGHSHPFFKECQSKLGHKLPLSAYLLKPVQRITKYQLLLKELLKSTVDPGEEFELRESIASMLSVLKHVNDVMHTVAIIGFKGRLSQQGKLILQGTFDISYENKKDKRALKEQLTRFKAQQRQVFLYEHAVLFCKRKDDDQRMKRSAYLYKSSLETCSIGLTENVKGDRRRFELWRGQRSEVYVLTAATMEVKQQWSAAIKQLLQAQFTNMKERSKREIATVPIKRVISQSSVTSSPLPREPTIDSVTNNNFVRSASKSLQSRHSFSEVYSEAEVSIDDTSWPSEDSSSECQYSDIPENGQFRFFVALADYNAVDNNEVTMREGDSLELVQVGHQGWWYVRHVTSPDHVTSPHGHVNNHHEGWVPASYLEVSKRRSTISLQSLTSSHSINSSHSIHSSHSNGSITKEVPAATDV